LTQIKTDEALALAHALVVTVLARLLIYLVARVE